MTRVSVVLFLGLAAAGCSDALMSPSMNHPGDADGSATLARLDAAGGNQVVEAVTGSGHVFREGGQYWFTFTIHGLKTDDGAVQGRFQWRAHQGGGGSKVSGRVDCMSVDENQAWLGVVFEKAGAPRNTGKWASIWVVDHGEGAADLPDEVSIRWRGFPSEGNMPEDFCRDHWADDQQLLPMDAGNIQVHQGG